MSDFESADWVPAHVLAPLITFFIGLCLCLSASPPHLFLLPQLPSSPKASSLSISLHFCRSFGSNPETDEEVATQPVLPSFS